MACAQPELQALKGESVEAFEGNRSRSISLERSNASVAKRSNTRMRVLGSECDLY